MGGNFHYSDRKHAGQVLGEIIAEKNIERPILLALPRGGVPLAKEISQILHIPFDVLIVRKIGAPYNPEYGIGALSEDLIPLMQAGEFVPLDHLDDDVLDIISEEKKELHRRVSLYRGDRKLPVFKNRNVILIDDGLATGITAAAAARYLKQLGSKMIYLAVPVGPKQVHDFVTKYVDEIICPYRPPRFSSVGEWYKTFEQVSDDQVISDLNAIYPKQHLRDFLKDERDTFF
jgi:putative phosphoribosyl transferase